MRQRLGARKLFNFPMFHVACYFEQFWGISNPLFPVKNKETSGKIIITPFVFCLFFVKEVPQKFNITLHENIR